VKHYRLKDPVTGHEFTYDDAKITALGLEGLVIDKDPLGTDGLPAPAKPCMPLGEPLPGSAADVRRSRAKDSATKTGADK